MKSLKAFTLFTLPMAVLMLGCSSTPDAPVAATPIETTKPKTEAPATAKPGAGDGAGAMTPINTGAEPVPVETKSGPGSLKSTVYFDFDHFDIKPEFRETILSHAAYLSKNPNVTVSIEGHCDERGAREYNIALGDRRATAVRQLLKLQGVADKQISTISFGEERPVAMGHDENSWWQNRRTVFAYRQ